METEILKHKLIPKHTRISEEEANEILKKFNVEKNVKFLSSQAQMQKASQGQFTAVIVTRITKSFR